MDASTPRAANASPTPAAFGAVLGSRRLIPEPAPSRLSRLLWLSGSLLGAAAVFLADLKTGTEIRFSILYLVPIASATWFVGPWFGIALSLISGAGWFADHLLNRFFFSHPLILFWNMLVEAGMFLVVSIILSIAREETQRDRSLTRQLAMAYGRLDRELQIVASLQRRMLPESPPRVPGFEIAVHYATSQRTGGDYYDFFDLPGGKLGILIADASGHGSPATVLMAMMRILVHTEPERSMPPERVLAKLNAQLTPNIPWGQFLTAGYLVLDPESARLDYALAGHNPPYVVRRASGRLEELENPSGQPLGVLDTAVFTPRSTMFDPGDTLLVYTDGLTEAMDAESRLLGEEPVQRVLIEHRDEDAAAIRNRLLDVLARHVGGAPRSDDLTLIVLQARPR